MKGLILSGGKGSRLRPLAHTSPKQLIPIANRPILFYAIETLAAAAIADIGIIIGDRGEEIRSAVGDGERFGVSITYLEQDAPRGLAHAVQVAQPFVGADDFVMYLGDNLTRHGIAPIVEAFAKAGPDALVVLTRVAEPQHFGIAELQDGLLVRLVEKPRTPKSDLAVVGIYVLTPSVFDAITRIDYSARGELEITDAIQRMIDDGRRVATHVIAGAPAECGLSWVDAGSIEGVLTGNRLALDDLHTRVAAEIDSGVRLDGTVVIEPGAQLRDCLVRGPAIIGADAVIERATIGPYTSIAAGCVVRGAEIENSILLQGSTLDNAGRLTSSLIGRECSVRGAPSGVPACRLVLGDDSQVELG